MCIQNLHLWRQHPSEKEPEERKVSERNEVSYNPVVASVVTVEEVVGGNVFDLRK